MKIAFFVSEFPSLSETFILNQITGLLDRGHDVYIYANKPGNYSFVHADVEKYNLIDRTFYRQSIHQKIPINKFFRLTKAMVHIIKIFHKNPKILFASLNIFKFGKAAASLTLLYEAVAYLKNNLHESDIVHCHFGQNGNLAVLLKDIGLINGKIITTFHGSDISAYPKKFGDNVYNSVFQKCDLLLPISERWKDKLISLGCKEKNIFVHRMGIDIKRNTYSPRFLNHRIMIKIITVSRLVEKKGVRYGIKAISKILNAIYELKIEYRIIGDGPLKNDLDNLINSLNLDKNIKLLGWKKQEDIVELMKDSDILLAPSVTSEDGDQEGIPVVLMEALAQGLPVVSTHHSGIPELVQDGVSGFLVPERDVDALAEKLKYLITHPEHWAKMGKAGRDYVEDHYDIDKLNDQLVNIYQRLLDGELP